ncbi:DUF5110 domain-containing protein [candidate division KSB3 bacterium]|uniref:DUF5110 domain-containing protein n=1 Tax=candidate division KSB3 bacterium TaxID=2044937 RepID=A0A9D5JV20_9BACT|nr:DUF5110 domain-containing protein [candidate division KSB3 bacterium]MBD3324797.1 DUF5110 domain-containing protein [candidate division KSB3 bacterium]
MNYVEHHFKLNVAPAADPQAMVHAPHVRVTVLTPRLIRLEYSAKDCFDDQPTLTFWNRHLPVPEFEVVKSETSLEIRTEYLHLRYQIGQEGFTPRNLTIDVQSLHTTWRPGDWKTDENLRGTIRTLDDLDGWHPLDEGLMSRTGWSVIDDSATPVLTDEGWFAPRDHASDEAYQDLYFFGYGHAYKACLQDYCRIAGRVPLIPRWILGNWWSRYYAYTDEELKALMEEFERREIPLAVCIIDMDWHLVDNPYTRGWTGYTWNRECFPQAEEFIEWLHQKGLRTSLNLHPADGVHPHEAQYQDMAEFMGIDPSTERGIPFDIADPKFAYAYFHILHHPYERMGIDFWWLDWQQGTSTSIPGLDPLFALNHLHFYDSGRDPAKRPFIFSRWGGYGSHRYPIGFSGDSVVSWDSLSFQPYFTATAANVGYGWWSHDIGGHFHGTEDPELYTRWVQFGVFSPILRLHCTNNPAHERRPWGYSQEVLEITREAMQLRHALIPYLYTMAWRNSTTALPLVQPMYYDYPECDAAYNCPNQYLFGTELMAAPFTVPQDEVLHLARQVIWFPEGDWFDFFSGEYYEGNRWRAIYGRLDDIPVFAKAGAIVPLGPKVGWGGLDNPTQLDVVIFPGANNRFDLYEDDGETQQYTQGNYALTTFTQTWQPQRLELAIQPVQGATTHIPLPRNYTFYLRGIIAPEDLHVSVNAIPREVASRYDTERETLIIGPVTLAPDEELVLVCMTTAPNLLSRRDRTYQTCWELINTMTLESYSKGLLLTNLEHIIRDIGKIRHLKMREMIQAQRLFEVDAAIARAVIEIITKRELFSHVPHNADRA